MKKLFTILAALLITATLWAQSPEKISYQAVIRDASDNLVTSQTVGMQISILQSSASGTAVYVETQTPTTNTNGLVSLEIGTGTVESGDFTAIDWTAGPYFIKTETDPAGGTSYSITGTSQLLSVPYALHSKTADTVTGTITETDPVFGTWDKSTGISITESQISDLDHFTTTDETDPVYSSSEAANITATDITNLGNLSGVNTGDQDLSTMATKAALGDSTAQVRSEIPDVSGIATNTQAIQDTAAQIRANIPTNNNQLTNGAGYITDYTETDPSVPTGTQTGEMLYWDGSEWIKVEPGYDGATLTLANGVPTWEYELQTGEVENPTTGKVWMDKNIGASQVATSSNDALAYGDLYQWGRAADGHEDRSSSTTSTNATSAVPNDGNTWDGLFITEGSSPYDWLTPQDDNLWQGVSGTNNPCPAGYRLPTEAEWEAERTSWSSNNAAGAFASPLKLPVAGSRTGSTGTLFNVGSYGYYWSSTVDGADASYLGFNSSNANMFNFFRADGLSVRCLKD